MPTEAIKPCELADSTASGVVITLERAYSKVKAIVITPQGTQAVTYVIDDIVVNGTVGQCQFKVIVYDIPDSGAPVITNTTLFWQFEGV